VLEALDMRAATKGDAAAMSRDVIERAKRRGAYALTDEGRSADPSWGGLPLSGVKRKSCARSEHYRF
jgi:hypothetical protein